MSAAKRTQKELGASVRFLLSKNETEVELVAELTPDLRCKERFSESELLALQGRLSLPGTYAKRSALEGTFQFSGEVPELAGTGSFKVSGMTLKISPSPDLTNPDVYIYVE